MPAVAPSADSTARASSPPTAARGERASRTPEQGLARLASVLLVYVVGLTALATLAPFNFQLRPVHGFRWYSSARDIALNLAFLFPAGFLLRLSRAGRGWPYACDALVFGLSLSTGFELAQVFLPTRVPSPVDLLANGLGAWAGGALHLGVGRFLDRRLHEQLSLHLPLTNLLYLLVPLLSLDALAAYAGVDLAPDLPLAGFMALIAAGLYRHRLAGSGRPYALRYALSIGLLFGIGSLPLGVRSWSLWGSGVLVMTLLTRAAIALGTELPPSERRFVPFTLRRALPFYGSYLALLAACADVPHWLASPMAGRMLLAGEQVAALRLVRDVAAFTLLGYVGAELQARARAPAWSLFARVVSACALMGLLFVALQHGTWQLGRRALGKAGLLSCAALAGALIHRAQLRLVLSAPRAASGARESR